MEFKRWQTLAAVACSLSFQVVALAQEAGSDKVSGIRVFKEAAEPPALNPPKPEDSKSEDQQSRVRLSQGGTSVEANEFTFQLPTGELRIIGLPNAEIVSSKDLIGDPNSVQEDVPLPKFVIGVSLSEVPESLRAHIALPEGTGVMVGSIMSDSPAAKSELQQYDILLKSGDKELKHPKDLQEIVDASEGKPVSITVQRKEEQKTVEVTPIKREELKFTPNAAVNWPVMPGTFFMQNGRLVSNGQLPPGMILPSAIPDQMAFPFPANNPQQMEALTESIHNLTEQVKRLQQAVDRMEKNPDANDDQPPENNRAKDEGDCFQVPRRNRLTTLISIS